MLNMFWSRLWWMLQFSDFSNEIPSKNANLDLTTVIVSDIKSKEI